MFGIKVKVRDKAPAPAVEPKPAVEAKKEERQVSVVARGTVFKGEVQAKQDLRIEGEVHGAVACENLEIAECGAVQATTISARHVVVHGVVNGDVKADSLLVKRTARIVGAIVCSRIGMEPGASIQGQVTCGKPGEAPQLAEVGRGVVEPVDSSMTFHHEGDGKIVNLR